MIGRLIELPAHIVIERAGRAVEILDAQATAEHVAEAVRDVFGSGARMRGHTVIRPPAVHAAAHVPPPPRAPDVDRELAAAVAARQSRAGAMWARRAERSESATCRPDGGVR